MIIIFKHSCWLHFKVSSGININHLNLDATIKNLEEIRRPPNFCFKTGSSNHEAKFFLKNIPVMMAGKWVKVLIEM